MATFIQDKQDSTCSQELDNIVLNKITEMTEAKRNSMALSLFCGIGITCTESELKFYSISNIRSKVEVEARRYSNSTALELNNLLSYITYSEINSTETNERRIIEDCDSKISTLTGILEEYGFTFSITSCPSYLPMKLEKNQVVCAPPLYYDQTEDSLFRVTADLICYFSKVKKVCLQCIDIRSKTSNSPELCLINLRAMESNKLWIPTIESAARIMFYESNVKPGSSQAIKFMNKMADYEQKNNPVFPMREIELNSPADFAQKLVVTEGVNNDSVTSYKMYWYLHGWLLPTAKMSSWLKEQYVGQKDNIVSFISLTITILRGPRFKQSLTTAVAYIWIWMDTTIANHGENHKEYYVEFVNKEVLKDRTIEPNTIKSLISSLKDKLTSDVKGAIEFCAMNNNIDLNIKH